jgi:hypothetical protein
LPAALDNEQLNLLLDRAAGSPFVGWSDRLPPDLAARAGVTPGSRARLDGDDLRLELECHAEGGELRLGLALAGAGSGSRQLDAALRWSPVAGLSATHPTVVLQDGAFHRVVEEPPADIVRMIAELHGVPLRREDAPLLDRLSSRFEGVAEAVRTLTRTHDARPVIAIDLRESDWLNVRLFAHTGRASWIPGTPAGEDVVLFEHTPDAGWARLASGDATSEGPEAIAMEEDTPVAPVDAAGGEGPGAPTHAAGDAGAAPWREVPEPARVAKALEWLDALGAARGDRRGPGSRAAGACGPA